MGTGTTVGSSACTSAPNIGVSEAGVSGAGVFVPREDTVRSFREILDGKHDDMPEDAFYMVAGIDAATTKAKEIGSEG